jgi:hypothetical protein
MGILWPQDERIEQRIGRLIAALICAAIVAIFIWGDVVPYL